MSQNIIAKYCKNSFLINPFLITDTSVFDLTLNEEEELILLSNNRDLILKHSEESINPFWINIRCDYPIIAKKALKILLQFSTSYLCEFGFSALTIIKIKKKIKIVKCRRRYESSIVIFTTKYK